MYGMISSSSLVSQPMATNSISSSSAAVANISPKVIMKALKLSFYEKLYPTQNTLYIHDNLIFQHPPRLADDNASIKTENTMSNLSLKMNNQDVERFEHQVEDMYSILVNISSELVNIKVGTYMGNISIQRVKLRLV